MVQTMIGNAILTCIAAVTEQVTLSDHEEGLITFDRIFLIALQ